MRTFAMTTLVFAGMFGWAIGGGFSHSRAVRPVAAAATTGPATATSPAVQDWQVPHSSGGTVVITKGWQGHYFTDGDVAGKPLNFIVDTGATTVALSRSEAQSVGVDVDHLSYDLQMQTASGISHAAPVTLPQLRIGDIQLLNVSAVVMDVPSDVALLGQSFLGRIDKVSIEGDKMTLTKL